jgi:hypothetical protein
MRFKLLGVFFLALGLYLVVHGVLMARAIPESGVAAQVYCLAAIFLAITVRVLQAERHHRQAARPPVVRSILPPLPDPELHAPELNIEDFDEILNDRTNDRTSDHSATATQRSA